MLAYHKHSHIFRPACVFCCIYFDRKTVVRKQYFCCMYLNRTSATRKHYFCCIYLDSTTATRKHYFCCVYLDRTTVTHRQQMKEFAHFLRFQTNLQLCLGSTLWVRSNEREGGRGADYTHCRSHHRDTPVLWHSTSWVQCSFLQLGVVFLLKYLNSVYITSPRSHWDNSLWLTGC